MEKKTLVISSVIVVVIGLVGVAAGATFLNAQRAGYDSSNSSGFNGSRDDRTNNDAAAPDGGNAAVPTVSDSSAKVDKSEPRVNMTFENLPFGDMSLYPFAQPRYAQPCAGGLSIWVADQSNATHIEIMAYFHSLSPEKVMVNSSFGSGAPVTALFSPYEGGCRGVLIDHASVANCTWTYDGSSMAYHNISIAVTTWALGIQEVKFVPFDMDTGAQIGDGLSLNYTVLGNQGAQFLASWSIFQTESTTNLTFPFTEGGIYDFTFTDHCVYPQYSGYVTSVLDFPFVERVWLVNDSTGTETLLEPNMVSVNGLSTPVYSITWSYAGDCITHGLHFRVQLTAAGSEYAYMMGFYYVIDKVTGYPMSPINGNSHLDGAGFDFDVPSKTS
ncbi:MAG: hypothetical protein SA339_11710 [Methanomassiliicoccus sp.]|nr:hypothetical protein [Methanomassiliicoccus sp.]